MLFSHQFVVCDKAMNWKEKSYYTVKVNYLKNQKKGRNFAFIRVINPVWVTEFIYENNNDIFIYLKYKYSSMKRNYRQTFA